MMRSLPSLAALAALAAVVLASAGCEQVEQAKDRMRDRTPHEAYALALADAGLATTAVARAWVEAARRAVEEAPVVQLPFHEEGVLAPSEPSAVAYRVRVERGQRLTAEVELDAEGGSRVFVDLFRVPDEDDAPLRPVFSTDSVPGRVSYEPWRAGTFILRLQPELLRGGRYRVTLRLEAQLAFPVEGLDTRAVQSVFGAPRDGGRRRHHGVDIFARRGTPALATSEGVVTRVETTNLGGKVVWLRDARRRASIYYAHLDRQAVRTGQRVHPGDTVGFVGNTGNARTTPPHLHFGIYRRPGGPTDPLPFIRTPPGHLEPMRADLTRLGSWVRPRRGGIHLREGPSRRSAVATELDDLTPLRVQGAAGDWYRVRLPDGTPGWVAARLTEPADRPVETRIAALGVGLRAAPAPRAPELASLSGGEEVGVLGRFGGYLLVRGPEGRAGWLSAGAI